MSTPTPFLIVGASVGALLSAQCSGTSVSDPAPSTDARRKNEPAWVRMALTQSREMMENRCVELAPLETVYAGDPTFDACMVDAMILVGDAWQRVYSDALNRCVSDAAGSRNASCCFARVPDDADHVARRRQECDDECARRVGREPGDLVRSKTCQPAFVSVPRRKYSRAHTPAVVEIVSRCQRGTDEGSACSGLPTYIERTYCGTYCEAERSKFNLSLSICSLGANEPGGPIKCNLDDPELRSECELRCREKSTRLDMP